MENGRVAEAAPVVHYTGGWTLGQLRDYFEGRRGGTVEIVQ